MVRKPIRINEKTVYEHAIFTVFGIAAVYPPLFKYKQLFLINFMHVISRTKITGVNTPGFELECIVEAIFDRFLTKSLKFYQKTLVHFE